MARQGILLACSFAWLVLLTSAAPAVDTGVEEIVYLMGQDNQCLGPQGFQACDWSAMWLFAKRKEGYSLVSMFEPNQYEQCLDRKRSLLPWRKEFDVRPYRCSDKGAKYWDIIEAKRGMVYVTQQDHKYCLARGRKKYRHSVTMVSCNKDPDQLVLQILSHNGLLFETVDGLCFDGQNFITCDSKDKSLYFGVGVKFDWKGRAKRYIYKYHDPTKCIVASGNKVRVGSCTDRGALDWGWKEGRLTHESGSYCVVRLANEETAALTKCYEGFEYLNVGTPQTAEDYLEYLLKYEPNVLEQMLKQTPQGGSQTTQQQQLPQQQQQQQQQQSDRVRPPRRQV